MELVLFTQLAAVIILATTVCAIMRLLKQPLIIGYIVAGVLVGPQALGIIPQDQSVAVFSQLGIAFLLFLVGIGLDPFVIKEVGRVALLSGIGQVVFTAGIGAGIAVALGYTLVESTYIAIALTLSSTIIVMKLLSDKNELETLHGKIAMGILLVQDVVALLTLLVVSSFAEGSSFGERMVQTLGFGALLVAIIAVIAVYVLPRVLSFFAASQELLFLFAIGWVFLVASLFNLANFSLEMGALIAGVALSMSPYRYEMSAKVKPLRDFFVLIFFILLGSQMIVSDVFSHFWQILVFSLFILVGNPLIVFIILNRLGYTQRTAFLTGLTMAQISEFSFILVGLGAGAGHLSQGVVSMVTTVGLITIAGSTYLIMNSESIYVRLAPILARISKPLTSSKKELKKPLRADVLLFGYNRIGHDLLKAIKAIRKSVLVLDYNPDTIAALQKQGVACLYGDANDQELLDSLPMSAAKMAISTIPNEGINRLLLHAVKRRNKKIVFICVSHQIDEALRLYESGASYVLLPHFLGGSYAAHMIERHGVTPRPFGVERKNHVKSLHERRKLGHEHPRIQRRD